MLLKELLLLLSHVFGVLEMVFEETLKGFNRVMGFLFMPLNTSIVLETFGQGTSWEECFDKEGVPE